MGLAPDSQALAKSMPPQLPRWLQDLESLFLQMQYQIHQTFFVAPTRAVPAGQAMR